jgi:hypothetical protein
MPRRGYWLTGNIAAQERRNDVSTNAEVARHGKPKDGK